MESSDGQEIVDFDETIPAHDLGRGSIALPLLVRAGASGAGAPQVVPLSEPPPAPPPPATTRETPPSRPAVELLAPAPPAEQADRRAEEGHGASGNEVPSERPQHSAPPALIAPVVMPAPRAPSPQGAGDGALIPRPPPSSRQAPPPSGGSRPSPAPVVTQVEHAARSPYLTEPPPELDGSSKRRRMVRIMVAALVIGAVGITWSVVRSQLEASPGPAVPQGTTTAVVPPPPPPQPPPSAATSTATAVDPGKVTHPGKPTPSGPTPGVHNKGPVRGRVPKQPTDGTIVVPDPDEDSVPAAP
jgi:hypothetical protein